MDITLESPLDMHLHLREGDMLDLTVPSTANNFAGAVIMPNLVVPVDSIDYLRDYRQAIEFYCHDKNFEPYMTLFLRITADRNSKNAAPTSWVSNFTRQVSRPRVKQAFQTSAL